MRTTLRTTTIASPAIADNQTMSAARRPNTKGRCAVRRIVTVVAVILAAMGVYAGSAFAKPVANPAPTCPKGYNFNASKGTCDPAPPTPQCPKGYNYDQQTKQCETPQPTATCTTINGVQFCNQEASMQVSESDQKVANLKLTSGGVLQLKLEMNPAPPKSQIGVCRRVVGGLNSFFNNAHQLVWISWAGKVAYICHTGRGPTGWQKVGPGKRCWNFFKPPFVQKRLPVFTGTWKLVQNFNYTAKLSLTLTLHATVNAKASCAVAGAAASGTAMGSDTESIVVTGVGSGRTFAQAASQAHTAALNSQSANNLSATVTAKATAKMQASATASCQAPPPTSTPTPTPTPGPQYACTNLSLSSTSIQTGQSVTATTSTSQSNGANLQNVSYGWGDGSSSTDGTTSSHTYNSAGTFTITATANFSLPNGTTSSSTSPACQRQVVVTAPPSPPVTLTLSNLTQPQNGSGGIAPDGEGPISVCVTATDTKAGDTVKLTFSNGLGSFASSGIVSFTSTGADTRCLGWTAPNDSADVGKTETWTVSGVDVTAGVNSTGPNNGPNPSVSFVYQSPSNGGQHP